MQTAERTRELVAKVQAIELKARRTVESSLSGAWRSVFRGRGMDFEETRPYAPGDEVRAIDWNVTARTGAPHVKQFAEERDLTLMLLVDVSASTLFGSGLGGSNRDHIAELAAVLALSAQRQNDAVGLVLFSDRVEGFLPPGKGREHVLRLIREILACEPAHRGTDLGTGLDLLLAFGLPASMTVLVSDFAGVPAELPADLVRKLRTVTCRHDLLALAVDDPLEFEPPAIGPVLLEDLESGDQVELDLRSRRVRKAWIDEATTRRRALRRGLRRFGVDLYETRTDRPYLPVLLRMFHGEGGRR